MILYLVPVADVTEYWGRVRELFARLDGEHSNSTHMLRTFEAGRRRMWMIIDDEDPDRKDPVAVFSTEIINYPLIRACRIGWCAGDDMANWKHLLPNVEEFAEQSGCDIMEIRGRKGWQRAFPEYSEKSVIIEKKLCS